MAHAEKLAAAAGKPAAAAVRPLEVRASTVLCKESPKNSHKMPGYQSFYWRKFLRSQTGGRVYLEYPGYLKPQYGL